MYPKFVSPIRLVELIVLNIGLQAGILDGRTFSMFVVHALVLTFITTPLTLAFYPPKHRTRDNLPAEKPADAEAPHRPSTDDRGIKTRFSLVLDRIEQLPAAMTLSQLLHPTSPVAPSATSNEKVPTRPSLSELITINAFRLFELTNRTSAVLRSQEADSLLYNDPVVSVFRTYGQLNSLKVTASLDVAPFEEFPAAISKSATNADSDLIILPWSRGPTSILQDESGASSARNPFDGAFHRTTTQDQTGSVVYSEFIRKVFLSATRDVALFVDRGLGIRSANNATYHLFLPFIGGPDDRLALSFLVQLCMNTSATATVVRIQKTDGGDLSRTSTDIKPSQAAFLVRPTLLPWCIHTSSTKDLFHRHPPGLIRSMPTQIHKPASSPIPPTTSPGPGTPPPPVLMSSSLAPCLASPSPLAPPRSPSIP